MLKKMFLPIAAESCIYDTLGQIYHLNLAVFVSRGVWGFVKFLHL